MNFKQKEPPRVREPEDRLGVGTDVCPRPCLKHVSSKDPPGSAGNSVQCYVAAWMGGLGENGSVYMYG